MATKIEIKDGKFVISGEFQPPERSKSGKTYVVATSRGFTTAVDNNGKTYSVSFNIITK